MGCDNKDKEYYLRELLKLPIMLYLKNPVEKIEKLYERYPDGGEYGWFAWVNNIKTFAYWDTEKSVWGNLPVGLLDLLGIDAQDLKNGDAFLWSTRLHRFVPGNMYNAGVMKTYPSYAAMQSDIDSPIGDDGKNILNGQMVCVSGDSSSQQLDGVYAFVINGVLRRWEKRSNLVLPSDMAYRGGYSGTLATLYSDLSSLRNDFHILSEQSPSSFDQGFVIIEDGDLEISASGYGLTKYSVSEGERYYLKSHISYPDFGIMGYGFYSSESINNSTFLGGSGELTNNFEFDGEIEIPAGCTVLALSVDEKSHPRLSRLRYSLLDISLKNRGVDNCYVEDGRLYLTYKDKILASTDLPAGGGGGGTGSFLQLTSLIENTLITTVGSIAILRYNFVSRDSATDASTGSGMASYLINNISVATYAIDQGDVSFDISPYLSSGVNNIRISVTDSYGTVRNLVYTVHVVHLSLSSTFDETLVYTGDILFKYTPVGNVEKTIHFEIDGVEIGSVTTLISNKQRTYTIPAQNHGGHILKVYAESSLYGNVVRSNDLYFGLMCVESGNNTALVSSSFSETSVEQYSTVVIPFMVYKPNSSMADVSLLVNGKTVSTRHVDRTLQRWSYTPSNWGAHTFTIRCGDAEKTFSVNVTKSSIGDIGEVEGLVLKLTSIGRSNTELTPGSWTYDALSCVFTDFNWTSNGWILDSGGNSYLRVNGDARVVIPFKVFSNDFRQHGKTLEFAFFTENVSELQTVLLSCLQGGKGFEITPQKVIFKSEQSELSARFKENELVRISISVEQSAKNRLIYLYINGILSGVVQYPVSDNFMQTSPANIYIGSNKATIGLYAIRIYDTDLNHYQIMNNYVEDLPGIEKKIALFERNQIFNEYGDISYDLLLKKLPCMIITGDLPQYKKDKKNVAVSFTDLAKPEKSFFSPKVQIDVQGTSSQYYPRKNYKMKFKDGFVMNSTGETVEGFAVHADSIPVAKFTHKADFAEASGTHNTGMAKIVDRTLKALDILTPPQKDDMRIRTTVDGFAMAIFHRANESAPLTFLGKYNFNNDKGTEETFGFDEPAECWEMLNNTSDRTLFKSSEYDSVESDGTPSWLLDFEERYPDDDTPPTNLKRLTDWIVGCIGNPEKFRDEAKDYFDRDFLLSYYLITELFAMVDQRAKNSMWATFDTEKWLPIFYDNDTCLGINNEGVNVFDYNVEYHDKIGTLDVWNAESSALWKLVEDAFPDKLRDMYVDIRQNGGLNYHSALAILNGEHSDLWSEVVYNEDGYFKYILPLLEEGNGSYLYAAQGSRAEHRKWWLFNRFRYMDSKYNTGDFKNDFLTMRLYTPSGELAIAPDANFTIEPFSHQYIAAKWGSYTLHKRCTQGETMLFEAPQMTFNDTETIIYGASYLKSIGDLSGKYAGTIDVSKAKRLAELIIGSAAEGYQNTNLTVLHVGNNRMLRRIDVQNCPNLVQPLDLSGCENIEEVYAKGTGLTTVILPAGGVLTKMELPETITNLTLLHQLKMRRHHLLYDNVSNLVTLRVEGMPLFNSLDILKKCFLADTLRLANIRCTSVDWQDADLAVINECTSLKGLDANGFITNNPVIEGKIHVGTAAYVHLNSIEKIFPELEVSYDNYRMFEDDVVQRYMNNKKSYYDIDGDGVITINDVRNVTNVIAPSSSLKNTVKFNELELFTSATEMYSGFFMAVDTLKEVKFPPNLTVTSMSNMFKGCSSLLSIPRIPESVIRMSYFATNCVLIKNIPNIPSGVTYAWGAFKGCTSLLTIPDLPAGLSGLDYIVQGCSSLKNITLLSTYPHRISSDCFNGTHSDFIIYVPDAALNAYKTATNWVAYADRIFPISQKPL